MAKKRAEFSHIARTLLTLLRAEREGRILSVTELLKETGMPSATFYTTVRDALTSYGFAEVVANPRERVVTVRLTDRGRKLAACFEEVGLARDLGLGESSREFLVVFEDAREAIPLPLISSANETGVNASPSTSTPSIEHNKIPLLEAFGIILVIIVTIFIVGAAITIRNQT